MSNDDKIEAWITLAMAIPVILAVVGIQYIPYELNWFVNAEASAPTWLGYVWAAGSGAVLAIMFKYNQPGNPIGSLMMIIFGPYALLIMGQIWVFKKLGWIKF